MNHIHWAVSKDFFVFIITGCEDDLIPFGKLLHQPARLSYTPRIHVRKRIVKHRQTVALREQML